MTFSYECPCKKNPKKLIMNATVRKKNPKGTFWAPITQLVGTLLKTILKLTCGVPKGICFKEFVTSRQGIKLTWHVDNGNEIVI